MTNFRIAPSILSADFAKLGQEVDDVLASGADVVAKENTNVRIDNHKISKLTLASEVMIEFPNGHKAF